MNRRRSGHGGMTSPSSTPPISPQMMPAQHDYQQVSVRECQLIVGKRRTDQPPATDLCPVMLSHWQRTSYGSEQPRYPPAGPMDQGQGWSRGSVSPVSRTSSSAAPFAFSTHNGRCSRAATYTRRSICRCPRMIQLVTRLGSPVHHPPAAGTDARDSDLTPQPRTPAFTCPTAHVRSPPHSSASSRRDLISCTLYACVTDRVAMPFRKPAQAKFSPGHVLRRPR